MKKIIIAITASILMAGLFIAPAAASAPSGSLSYSSCGTTYIVQGGDNIYKIAAKCGVPVSEILALNPQITDETLVYTGQVLRMTESADYAITFIDPLYWFFTYLSSLQTYPTESVTTSSYTNSYYSTASVRLSTTQAKARDEISIYVSGFPAYTQIDYLIGERGEDFTDVYDGATDANGKASITIHIPANANTGEYWVVQVATTSGINGINVYSPTIYITSSSGYGADTDVDLSTTEASAGDSITIYVSGFPAYADIDYRIGREGESYSAVYDGNIDGYGDASITITIPSEAKDGERWIVQVVTTSKVNEVEEYSPVIHITD